jgi:hypothetical protein
MMMDRSWQKFEDGVEVDSGFHEVTWEEVRRTRDAALLECDWRALKDVVLSTAWKEYRQALRDLGGHASANEAADNWPVAPDD